MTDYILELTRNQITIQILNSLFQITLIMVVAYTLSKCFFRKNDSGKFSLLYYGLLLMVVCPIFSKFNLLFDKQVIANIDTTSPIPLAAKASPIKGENIIAKTKIVKKTKTEPLKNSIAHKQNNISKKTTAQKPSLLDPKVQSTLEANSIVNYAKITRWTIILFWITGTLLVIFKIIRGRLLLDKIIRHSYPINNIEIKQSITQISHQLKLKKSPHVYTSTLLNTPIATGIFKPKVLLPEYIVTEFSQEEIASILTHELAHIARKDTVSGFAQVILNVILWFHPIFHLYNKELNRIREEICDQVVIQNSTAADYARTLLGIAEKITTKQKLIGAYAMTDSGNNLKKRIQQILNPIGTSSLLRKRFDIGLMLCLTITLFYFASRTQLIYAENKPTEIEKKTEIKKIKDLLNNKVSFDFTKGTIMGGISTFSKQANITIAIGRDFLNNKQIIANTKNLNLKNIKLKFALKWITKDSSQVMKIQNNAIFLNTKYADKNLILTMYPLDEIINLSNKNMEKWTKGVNKEGLRPDNVKEIIMEKIARDTWDETKGTSIEVIDKKLLIIHNQAAHIEIKRFLSTILDAAKKSNKHFPYIKPTKLNIKSKEELKIIKALEEKKSFEWKKASLKKILNDIQATNHSLNFVVDHNALKDLNQKEIDLKVKDLPLKYILKLAISQYGLQHIIIDETIYMSNIIPLTLERYDVRDICVYASEKSKGLTTEDVQNLIQSKLKPFSWDDSKGSSIVSHNGQLLVTQTEDVHQLIVKFLTLLRKGEGSIQLPK